MFGGVTETVNEIPLEFRVPLNAHAKKREPLVKEMIQEMYSILYVSTKIPNLQSV